MNLKHGMRHTRFYRIWKNIKARGKGFHPYCLGITYTSKWEVFDDFKKEMYASYLSHSKKYGEDKTSIDRIDNKKGYSKSNCRWATPKQQAKNRKSSRFIFYKGKTYTLVEWSLKLNMNPDTITERLKRGWTVSKALSKPVGNNARKRFPNKIRKVV